MIKILYEDNHLIAVFKPAGVLSQGDKTGDVSMYDVVKDYIRIKKGKPSLLNPGNAKPRSVPLSRTTTGVFLGLVHRLDRPVSGIILFAKTSKGASRLSEQFRNHEVEKIYHAVVLGKPEKSRGVLTNMLGKDTKTMKARNFTDGKEANLYYEVIKSNGKYSLLKIKIEGGKFHQIRVQLSSAGFPILGDVKYGAKILMKDPSALLGAGKSIALCATNLIFNITTGYKKISISIPIPKEWELYL